MADAPISHRTRLIHATLQSLCMIIATKKQQQVGTKLREDDVVAAPSPVRHLV